jgi:hypothetical protein
MAEYDLRIDGESSGPWSGTEVRQRLEAYRRDNPGDPGFSKVWIVRLPEVGGGTVGTPMPVYDFVPERPPGSSP